MAAHGARATKPKKSSTKRAPAATKTKKLRPAAKPKVKLLKASKPVIAAKPVKMAPPEMAPQVKPVKVSSGLSKSDLTHFRQLLLEKRREILGDVGTMESEAFKAGSNLSNMPIHMADVGTDNFEQEFTLGLIESERQLLREIQEALARIDDGSFGICLATGHPIGKVRLEAVPWAKYTKDYASALEQGLIRRDSAHRGEEESGDDEEE